MAPYGSLIAAFLTAPIYSSGGEVAVVSGSVLDVDDACRVGEDCSLGLRQLRGELKDRLAVQSKDEKTTCLGDRELGCKYSRDCCNGLECDLYSHRCIIDYSLGQLDEESQELVAKGGNKSTCLDDGELGCKYSRDCCNVLECDLYSHRCIIDYSLGQVDKESQGSVAKDESTTTCLGDGELGCKYSRDCCNGLECDLYSHRCIIDYSLGQLDKESQEVLAKDGNKSTCLGDRELGCKYSRDCCNGLECDLYSHRCIIDYSLGQLDKESQEVVAEDGNKSMCLGDGELGCKYSRDCCNSLECDLYSHRCIIDYSLGQVDQESKELVAKDENRSTCLGDGESGCKYSRDCCNSLECDLYSHRCIIDYSLGQLDKESQEVVAEDRTRVGASVMGK